TAPLDVIPLWLFFPIACLLGWLSLEGGYRLGAWRHAREEGEKEASVGPIVGSILALLAFMLAFTFGLAASRFEVRREVVLQEANAIGTTYLRVDLLPREQRPEAARLLREYVNVRVQGIQDGKIYEAIVRSEELHRDLWKAAMAAPEQDRTVMTG